MLESLLIVAAVVALLSVVLLLWPLRLRIWASPETALVDIRYLFVRLRLDLLTGKQAVHLAGVRVYSGKPKLDQPTLEEEEHDGSEAAKPSRQDGGLSRAKVLWAHRPLLRRVLLMMVRLIGRLLRSWTLERGRVTLALGLGDPASTGMAAGCLYAALPAVQLALPRWHIGFVPDFTRARVAVDLDIVLRLILLEPLYQIARTLGTLPWRRLWKLKTALSQTQ